MKIPEGLDLEQAGALPLVTTTGGELMEHVAPEAGQTVLVTVSLSLSLGTRSARSNSTESRPQRSLQNVNRPTSNPVRELAVPLNGTTDPNPPL